MSEGITEGLAFEIQQQGQAEPQPVAPEPAIAQEGTPQSAPAPTGEPQENGTPVAEPVVKTPYTPEEIAEILKNDESKLDFDRLSPEGKLIFREHQRGITPKLQEAAEIRKKMPELEQRLQMYEQQMAQIRQAQQPQAKPEPLEMEYQRFRKNPMAYSQEATAETAKLARITADDPRYEQAQDAIQRINAAVAGFQNRRIMEFESAQTNFARAIQQQAFLSSVQSETVKAVPEYNPDLRAKLTEYATQKMGYTEAELVRMTDPMQVGMTAVKNLKVVYDAWKRENAAASVGNKEVRMPTKVEPAGSGFAAQGKTLSPEQEHAEYIAERRKRQIT